jgi:hypothetical protein
MLHINIEKFKMENPGYRNMESYLRQQVILVELQKQQKEKRDKYELELM